MARSIATSSRRSVTAALRDGGTAVLRPLGDGETEVLLEVFEQMSPDSRALRYLTGISRLPKPMLHQLSAVDGDRHIAWVAEIGGRPAGIARAVRLPADRATADLAFEVVDAHQGRGLGTVLLDVVTTAAAVRGVQRVSASAAAENGASRHLLGLLGLRGNVSGGILEVEGPLRLLDPARVDRAAVVALVCATRTADTGESA